ncbi:MAG: hypothetical protein KF716_15000 [Anaerolineae bacterium]|nr:hypothetical protein [Anaerolineae bacterium]
MQNLVVINLKPSTSLTRYDASGWRKASLDGPEAVDGVIVRLLRGGWRLVSADQTSMYFALDVTQPAIEPKKPSTKTVPQVPDQPTKKITEPLQKGEIAEYNRPGTSYDKPVVAPIYVRPVPELVKEQSIPQPAFTRATPERVDLDEWLKS